MNAFKVNYGQRTASNMAFGDFDSIRLAIANRVVRPPQMIPIYLWDNSALCNESRHIVVRYFVMIGKPKICLYTARRKSVYRYLISPEAIFDHLERLFVRFFS